MTTRRLAQATVWHVHVRYRMIDVPGPVPSWRMEEHLVITADPSGAGLLEVVKEKALPAAKPEHEFAMVQVHRVGDAAGYALGVRAEA